MAWWLAASWLLTVLVSEWELHDPSLGTHMGSVAPAFWFTVTSVSIVLAPLVIVPLYAAVRRHRVAAPLVGAAVAVVGMTATYYGSGWVDCLPGRSYPNEGIATALSFGLPLGAALVGGVLLARHEDGRGLLGTATVVMSSTIIMFVVQVAHCGGVSSQVVRGLGELVLAIPGLPLLLVGYRRWARRRAPLQAHDVVTIP